MNTIQEIREEAVIGKIVAADFRAAEVFKKYGIDFCCKGNRLLKDVCNEKKLDQASIEEEIQAKKAGSAAIKDANYEAMELDALAAHIESAHHTYVRDSIPVLLGFLNKVNKVHGDRHPELDEIYQQFYECANELTHHMVKEESIVFPAVKRLANAHRAGAPLATPFFFGTLANPINVMQQEHSTEGDRFARITELTDNFTSPADACTTYRVSFQKLNEFGDNLFLHIHLENNILFPRALEMEAELARL